jgi:hypothetical protein
MNEELRTQNPYRASTLREPSRSEYRPRLSTLAVLLNYVSLAAFAGYIAFVILWSMLGKTNRVDAPWLPFMAFTTTITASALGVISFLWVCWQSDGRMRPVILIPGAINLVFLAWIMIEWLSDLFIRV